MRLVIVGSTGYWGSKWLRVATGHDIVAEINSDGAERIGEVEADAAIIATPPETHAEISIAAMRAGLDVLVEKPMALSHADAELMQYCAVEHGRVLAVDSTFLHSEAFAYLKSLNEPLLSYQSLRVAPGQAHVHTPAGWDLIVHDLAILEGFGEICLDGWGAEQGEVAQAALELRGGNAFIMASRAWPYKERSVVLRYESGTYLWKVDSLHTIDGEKQSIVLRETEETLKRVLRDFEQRCAHRQLEGMTDGRHGADVCWMLERLFAGNRQRQGVGCRVGRELPGGLACQHL